MTPGQIKFYRITQGLQQHVVAERVGVSPTRIHNLERGKGKPPTAEEAVRLRYVLNIPGEEQGDAS